MKTPKDGSNWEGSNGTKFRVITTIWLDDGHWVHYKSLSNGNEYSCFVESFLERFRELPE